MRPGTHRGFTFVELLIAGVMFGILMAALSGHLRATLVAWRRATTTVEQLQRARIGLERFERDLATAFIYEPAGQWSPKPEFGGDHLRTYLVRGNGTSGKVWCVTYDLQSDSLHTALARTSQTIAQAAGNIPGAIDTVLTDVSRLQLRYGTMATAGPGTPGQVGGLITWTNSWTDVSQSPRLIEVTLELGSSWVIPHTVRHVVVVPSGSLTPAQPAGP